MKALAVVGWLAAWLAIPVALLVFLPGVFRVMLVVGAVLVGLFLITAVFHLLVRLPAYIETASEYINWRIRQRRY